MGGPAMHHDDHPTPAEPALRTPRRGRRRRRARPAGPLTAAAAIEGGPPRVLPDGASHDDRRLGPLKDLDGYFPFEPPSTAAEWAARAEPVRRQILVAAGLWPMPTRPELVPVDPRRRSSATGTPSRRSTSRASPASTSPAASTGRRRRDGPTAGGPLPARPLGRTAGSTTTATSRSASEIESGAERFEVGGRHPLQARCVQLARMGCVVFLYDMIGYADSVPITYEVAHRFAEQRPELSGPDRWGLFSAQAELRLQNVLGLQLLNSIRALDFVLGAARTSTRPGIAVTGASGGGTQTFLLAAVDPRPAAAFPAVMVSTAMQGGCTCENASYLRIGTGNVEFAALIAPKPLGMTGANDWTVEIETKGLPELKRHLRDARRPRQRHRPHFDFGHNYNAVSRAMMYDFMNEHLELGSRGPIEERDYEPLTDRGATVWDAGHPKPPTDEDAEVRLLAALDADSDAQMEAIRPVRCRSSLERVPRGRRRGDRGDGRPVAPGGGRRGLRQEGGGRPGRLPGDDRPAPLRGRRARPCRPSSSTRRSSAGRVAIWIDGRGKAALYDRGRRPDRGRPSADGRGGSRSPAATCSGRARRSGRTGRSSGRGASRTRGSSSATRSATTTRCSRSGSTTSSRSSPSSGTTTSARPGSTWSPPAGPAAGRRGGVRSRGRAVDALAVDTGGFRFGRITEIRDPDLWPGAVKYGDLPGPARPLRPDAALARRRGRDRCRGSAADAYAAAGASGTARLAGDGGAGGGGRLAARPG